MCAASWRAVSGPSAVFVVSTSSRVSWSSARDRSTSWPSAFASTAALASPAPIESRTKSPIAVPARVCFWLPSGSVTVTLASFIHCLEDTLANFQALRSRRRYAAANPLDFVIATRLPILQLRRRFAGRPDAGVPSRHQRPRNRGHCLVVTREHFDAIYALDDAVAASLLLVVRSAAIRRVHDATARGETRRSALAASMMASLKN